MNENPSLIHVIVQALDVLVESRRVTECLTFLLLATKSDQKKKRIIGDMRETYERDDSNEEAGFWTPNMVKRANMNS